MEFSGIICLGVISFLCIVAVDLLALVMLRLGVSRLRRPLASRTEERNLLLCGALGLILALLALIWLERQTGGWAPTFFCAG